MFSSVPICSGPQHGATVVGSYAYNDAALINLINFHTGSRLLRWRVDLCTSARTYTGSDGSPQYKGDITPYVSKMIISCDGSRAVSRSLDLTMVETAASQTVTISGGTITSAGISYLSDLVRPVALIGVPGTTNWIHCPLGAFRFTRPGVVVPGFALVRTATMPDLTSVVQESSAIDPTNIQGVPITLPAGYAVIDIIRSLLINDTANVQDATNAGTQYATLPGCKLGDWLPSNAFGSALAQNTPGDWPAITAKLASDYQVSEGTSYLDLINHLLKTINCYPLQADERGILRVHRLPTTTNSAYPDVPVPDYQSTDAAFAGDVATKWHYDTTSDSIVTYGLTEDILIDDIANIVQVRIEDGTRTPYLATAINQDTNSPYNVNNWAGTGQQRRISRVIDDGQIPDIDASTGVNYAKQYAARELLQASWLTDQVQLPIAVNPLHAGYLDHDVIALNIYQQYVAAGSAQNNPVITGAYIAGAGGDPGLVITEQFLVDGWTITANLPTPGSGSNLTGNTGLTTELEPRETKPGNTMTIRAHRTTKTLHPAGISFLPP